MNIAEYTFLPWFRRGLSNFIAANTDDDRAILDVDLFIKTEPNGNEEKIVDKKQIGLVGAGDVASFNQEMIIKTEPRNGNANFEANYLPYIEFYEEDFPWRYSPGASPSMTADQRLKPWLIFMVLKEEEFHFDEIDTQKAVQSITIKAIDPFEIPHENHWAWAHVQINQSMKATDLSTLKKDLQTLLKSDPDLAFSRLICPRKLEKSTTYYAFLLPFYENGRLGGLGKGITGIKASTSAWEVDISNFKHIQFPFYYQLKFTTADDGDFETLAKRLKAKEANNLETPTLDINSLNVALGQQTKPTILDFQGAYKQIGELTSTPLQHDLEFRFIQELNKNLTSTFQSTDPIVAPPLYGLWPAANNPSFPYLEWFKAINLNPVYRAVAALGVKIVQDNQEKFMDEAWEQVGAIDEANQKLRQAQFAIEINRKMLAKHFDTRPEEDVLAKTERVHINLNYNGQTIENNIKNSHLSKGGVNAGLRKLIRPNGKIAKKLNKKTPLLNKDLLGDLNKNTISSTPSRPQPYNFSQLNKIADTLNDKGFTSGEKFVVEQFNQQAKVKHNASITAPLNSLKESVLAELEPMHTLGEKILHVVKFDALPGYDLTTIKKIEPIMVYPEFPYPMAEYLEALSADFIIPGLSGLANNSVLLLEPNQAFIEAFMLGLNHEMSRELLWRGYPTDQKGTYFRQFWDTDDFLNLNGADYNLKNILPIHEWSKELGEHQPSSIGKDIKMMVMILRGDLLNKFPNTVVFAQKAKFVGGTSQQRVLDLDNPSYRFPIFRSQIAPDITTLGFLFTPDVAKGNETDDAGWFFMFQERAGEIRFGLDDNTTPKKLEKWDDLAWQHLDKTTYVDLDSDLAINDPMKFKESDGTDAAQLAHILYQSPFMLGIHATDLLI